MSCRARCDKSGCLGLKSLELKASSAESCINVVSKISRTLNCIFGAPY